MILALQTLGTVLIWFPTLRELLNRMLRSGRKFNDAWMSASGCVVMTAANALQADWPWCIAFAVLAVLLAARMWRRRRKRRALALLGAKAKARIAAMVGAMRERAKPRPVLRPGLQGAR